MPQRCTVTASFRCSAGATGNTEGAGSNIDEATAQAEDNAERACYRAGQDLDSTRLTDWNCEDEDNDPAPNPGEGTTTLYCQEYNLAERSADGWIRRAEFVLENIRYTDRLDGVFEHNGWLYMFRGSWYAKYDLAARRHHASYRILDTFDIGSHFSDGIDTCFNDGRGYVYFFRGSRYIKYDMDRGHTVNRLYQIADRWNGLPRGMNNGIEAAFQYNRWAYLFRGGYYAKYDLDQHRTELHQLIDNAWRGLEMFEDGVDAVVNGGQGIAYFFKIEPPGGWRRIV